MSSPCRQTKVPEAGSLQVCVMWGRPDLQKNPKKHLLTKSLFPVCQPKPQTLICFQSTRLCQGLASWVWPCFGQGTFGELSAFWS